MNARRRFLGALRGDPIDRVPLFLEGFHYASPAQVKDPLRREIVERIGDQLHLFTPRPYYVSRYLVTPHSRMSHTEQEQPNGDVVTTTTIETPHGQLTAVTAHNSTSNTSWTIKYPIENPRDIEWIRSVPWESPLDLNTPSLHNPSSQFVERGIGYASVSTPAVCVAGMMPYEMFLELCVTEFGMIESLTRLCLERILDALDSIFSSGTVEYVGIYGCEWLTPPMASPRLYEALVQDFETVIIERIHARGALAHVHCHGNIRSSLQMVIDRGADFLEPVEPPPDGDITFAEAKSIAAGRITLGGNIESRILETGDADDVEEATRRAFDGGTNRMVLKTTSEPIAGMTQRLFENYHRMLDVWDELSVTRTTIVEE